VIDEIVPDKHGGTSEQRVYNGWVDVGFGIAEPSFHKSFIEQRLSAAVNNIIRDDNESGAAVTLKQHLQKR
jgi:hypothetical protein